MQKIICKFKFKAFSSFQGKVFVWMETMILKINKQKEKDLIKQSSIKIANFERKHKDKSKKGEEQNEKR